MPDKRIDEAARPSGPTPDRPKSTGSRQQTHPDQKSQTEQTALSEQFNQPGTK